jgi:hypothetical protein
MKEESGLVVDVSEFSRVFLWPLGAGHGKKKDDTLKVYVTPDKATPLRIIAACDVAVITEWPK